MNNECVIYHSRTPIAVLSVENILPFQSEKVNPFYEKRDNAWYFNLSFGNVSILWYFKNSL